jgi:chromosome segregation ATPase
MKVIIPWVLVAALLGGVYFLYSGSQRKDADIAQLRQENQEIPKLRETSQEAQKVPALTAEIERLTKDNVEVLHLRNEVGQLRDAQKQTAAQLQKAQSQLGNAQSQLGSAQQEHQRLASQVADAQARADQQAQLAAKVQSQTQGQAQTGQCVNNLRQIDGAKQQWALENRKPANAVPTPADIAPYLPNHALPTCPAGGAYTINSLQQAPTCSIPGHALQ